MFKGQSLCTNVTILMIDLAFLHLQQILESVILGDTMHIKCTSVMLTKINKWWSCESCYVYFIDLVFIISVIMVQKYNLMVLKKRVNS